MSLAAGSAVGVTAIDWRSQPGPEAFERFYRQVTDRDDLPTIPEVARRLTIAVNRDTTTGRELAALLSRDPTLTAKLLRLANSAFFALRRPVTDVTQAVTLLGFGAVRDLVMTLSLWGSLGDKDPATRARRKALWAHCASVGALAKLLAKKVGRVDAGEALSAGLLHDIGKLLFGLRLGATYWDMLDTAATAGTDSNAIEMDAFGVHHGIIGQCMLQLWSLPESLCEAVARHHDVLATVTPIGIPQVVGAANQLVRLTTPEHEPVAGAILEILAPHRLRADMWPMMRDELAAEQRQIAGFFGDA
jgi:putative nucleotidyltransferase with HDIG domain